jgi:N-acetylglutamate synthase-like GNAT family acetyltransferase
MNIQIKPFEQRYTKDVGELIVPIQRREFALRKMFVAADCRGAEAGVARRLLDALLDHARSRRLREIYLGTTDKFLAVHRFYEKHGFELVDPAGLPKSFPRMSVDSRFYRLDLNPNDGARHG